jgi:pimeloyl-ACP methyl ester carboxylesterase
MARADRDRALPRWRRRLLIGLGAVLVAVVGWTWWAETHPEDEREVRLAWRAALETWFPEAMAPSPREHGWFVRREVERPGALLVLVHGLDEPGNIWNDLVDAFADEPWEILELRYPNDQAIDRSGAFLAERWPELGVGDQIPVILIGHSMGGLVIREFVSGWRHPVGVAPRVGGAPVAAAFLVATPNHGSEWARLRCWLELREQFSSEREREFGLFASLRDGVGTAKIDLRPGSHFLTTLNARPWPASVNLRLVAGELLEREVFTEGFQYLRSRLSDPDPRRAAAVEAWWERKQDTFGDGVVTVESVELAEADELRVLAGSHRGLLLRGVPGTGEPPALEVLRGWIVEVAAPARGGGRMLGGG